MKRSIHFCGTAVTITCSLLCVFLGVTALSAAEAQSPSAPPSSKDTTRKGSTVTHHAIGTFDVKLNAQAPHHKDEAAPLGRMSIDKQFHGDLDATSKGEMLAAGTEVKGSAGYVAMERVTGKLHGRNGTFVLQHSGTMNRGSPQLSVTVVPDSGTAQLKGMVGKMAIK
ncbi:MAG: DUF3224 domain-containing protein, partial [Burkholderiales bacterium]|nr:DUF3224 domain-containing protein [Burkholderiales bacterium]